MPVSKSSVFYVLALVALLIGIPLALLYREASRSRQSLGEYLRGLLGAEGARVTEPAEADAAGATIRFLEKRAIGDPVGDTPPWITHLDIVDLDGDGLKDVVLCDAKRNQLAWIQQKPAGTYRERAIGTPVLAPAHVTPSDVDGDGDLDLLVAKMGTILPNNDKIGAVVVLENDGDQEFTNRVIAEDMARVTDVEAGDFDGDGDLDLAVGQFGYDDGEIRWMENKGDWEFESRQLLNLSGTIHAPVGDIDGDGDLDIAAVVSQEWEEIYVFENDGKANFQKHIIYGATNEDFGSS
ncbi:MAG: FG-GAP-like repeat-containing protein, partial [Acidobacteriota bacterium]